MTNFVAVIGPDTAFTPDFKPLMCRDFTDGVSNTLLIGESRRGVPWTRPEDLPLDMNVPLTGLGSYHGCHNNGFNVLMADGSVRFLKRSIDPKVLNALLTHNASQIVEPNSYRVLQLCHKRLTPRYRQLVAEEASRKRVHHLKSPRAMKAFLQAVRQEYSGS